MENDNNSSNIDEIDYFMEMESVQIFSTEENLESEDKNSLFKYDMNDSSNNEMNDDINRDMAIDGYIYSNVENSSSSGRSASITPEVLKNLSSQPLIQQRRTTFSSARESVSNNIGVFPRSHGGHPTITTIYEPRFLEIFISYQQYICDHYHEFHTWEDRDLYQWQTCESSNSNSTSSGKASPHHNRGSSYWQRRSSSTCPQPTSLVPSESEKSNNPAMRSNSLTSAASSISQSEIDRSMPLFAICIDHLVSFSNWARDPSVSLWIRQELYDNPDLRPEVRNGLSIILVYSFAAGVADYIRFQHQNGSPTAGGDMDMFGVTANTEYGLGIVSKTSLKMYNDPFGFYSFLKACISALIDSGAIPDNERQNITPKRPRRIAKNRDELAAFHYLKTTLVSLILSGDSLTLRAKITQILHFWESSGKTLRNERFVSALSLPATSLSDFSQDDSNSKKPTLSGNSVVSSKIATSSQGMRLSNHSNSSCSSSTINNNMTTNGTGSNSQSTFITSNNNGSRTFPAPGDRLSSNSVMSASSSNNLSRSNRSSVRTQRSLSGRSSLSIDMESSCPSDCDGASEPNSPSVANLSQNLSNLSAGVRRFPAPGSAAIAVSNPVQRLSGGSSASGNVAGTPNSFSPANGSLHPNVNIFASNSSTFNSGLSNFNNASAPSFSSNPPFGNLNGVNGFNSSLPLGFGNLNNMMGSHNNSLLGSFANSSSMSQSNSAPIRILRIERIGKSRCVFQFSVIFDVEAFCEGSDKIFLIHNDRHIAINEVMELCGQDCFASVGDYLTSRNMVITQWNRVDFPQFQMFVSTFQAECLRYFSSRSGDDTNTSSSFFGNNMDSPHVSGVKRPVTSIESSNGNETTESREDSADIEAKILLSCWQKYVPVRTSYPGAILAYEVNFQIGLVIRNNSSLGIKEDLWCSYWAADVSMELMDQPLIHWLVFQLPQLRGVMKKLRLNNIPTQSNTNFSNGSGGFSYMKKIFPPVEEVRSHEFNGDCTPTATSASLKSQGIDPCMVVLRYFGHPMESMISTLVHVPEQVSSGYYATIGTLDLTTREIFSRLKNGLFFHDIIFDVIEE